MTQAMKTVSENRCFGGVQGVYSHASEATSCEMTFGLFLPEEAAHVPVPVLWYLSCSERSPKRRRCIENRMSHPSLDRF